MRDDAAPGPSTPASAPQAPGLLGRADARNFGGRTLTPLGQLGGDSARQVALRIALEPGEVVGAIPAHHRQPGRREGATCFAWVARELEGGPKLQEGHPQPPPEVLRLAKR